MKIIKKKDDHYLHVKINAKDRKYLEGYRKYSSAKAVKDTDKFLSDMISIHTRTVFVMETAMLLEAEKKIKSDRVDSTFNELDKSLSNYENVVNKYFVRLGTLLNQKNKNKTTRTRK